MRFQGKTVLVTGGGSGIGSMVARRLASEGARVAVLGRRSEPVRLIAQEINGLPLAADASDPSRVKSALDTMKEALGPPDILICVAGGGGEGSVLEMTDESWKSGARSTLDSAFVCARAVLPDLIERKGNVVFVSSAAGRFAVPGAAGHATMKHTVIRLARALARGQGPKCVRPKWPAWAGSSPRGRLRCP